MKCWCCVLALVVVPLVHAQSRAAATERVVSVAQEKVLIEAVRADAEVSAAAKRWMRSNEAVEVNGWPLMKRLAAVWSLVRMLKEQDTTQFPNAETDARQQTALLLMRLHSYRTLRYLLHDGAQEQAMAEFIGGEIDDLRLTLAHQIPRGLYQLERERRFEKVAFLHMTNETFARESVSQLVSSDATYKLLAKLLGSITAVAATDSCARQPDLCGTR